MDPDIFTLKKALTDILRKAMEPLAPEPGPVPLGAPRDPSHGDLSSPAALGLAKVLHRPPLEIAREIAGRVAPDPAWFEGISVAPPGFLNVRISHAVFQGALRSVLAGGDAYGTNREHVGRRVLLEFVSANPTGPLNIVSARAAALGDSMARLLRASGAEVSCEYYVNDAGVQARLFGESLAAACHRVQGREAQAPEGGYQGPYMEDLARELLADPGFRSRFESGDPGFAAEAGTVGMEKVIEWHRASLDRYRVRFDRYFSERKELHETGKVSRFVEQAKARGLTFEQDGALWIRVSGFGAPKDEVLVKRDGTPAYFAPDIAYHLDKYERGFDRLVDILGPDHHGHILRMKSAMKALGRSVESLDILIAQQVNLLHEGEKFKMSKREGRFITMDELVGDVGTDAARFFFNMRSANAHLDFDLEVARKQTDENPVYYVQYAHARICSLLRKAGVNGVEPDLGGASFALLREAEERVLLSRILEYPDWVAGAAQALEPHRIVSFLQGLAADFHVFYDRHRILGAPEGLDRARAALASGVRQVLRNGLDLLGVSAPERM